MKHPALFSAAALLSFAVSVSAGSAQMAASNTVTVPMHQQNGSGQAGTAKLTQKGPDVVVTIALSHGTTTPQPAHIHDGTCATLNPAPKYPLTSVVNGKSTSTVKNVKLSALETGGFAINVHKSAAALKTYTSCGDIPKAGG